MKRLCRQIIKNGGWINTLCGGANGATATLSGNNNGVKNARRELERKGIL